MNYVIIVIAILALLAGVISIYLHGLNLSIWKTHLKNHHDIET